MFHPWRALRALTHINVRWVPMDDRLGDTDGISDIRMHPNQLQVQRRCTITHELAHVTLGHIGGCDAGEEAAANEWAARRLITMDALKDALLWADDLGEVADELWVDLDTLKNRLDCLTDEERQELVDMHNNIEQGA